MEHHDVIVVGAGTAGLSAARILAKEGKDVLVVERNERISKPCAGGLTHRGLPYVPSEFIEKTFDSLMFNTPWYSMQVSLGHLHVSMVKKKELALWMMDNAVDAGAEVQLGIPVTSIYRDHLDAGGSPVGFDHLIGADGSRSIVRRSLGLPSKKMIRALQYRSRTLADDLQVYVDLKNIGIGYAWVFPHDDFTSVGVGGDLRVLNSKNLKIYLDGLCRKSGKELTDFEAAAINYDYHGFKFGKKYLAGDAAGCSFGLTGEGIYQAMVTGREIACGILDANYQFPKMKDLLKAKQQQEKLFTLFTRNNKITESLIRFIFPGLNKHRFLLRKLNNKYGIL